MFSFLVEKIHDARFVSMVLAAIAVSATAYTLMMPLFAGEGLSKRMKAVASERERIRQRERERLSKNEKVSLRQTPKQLVSKVVEDFTLGNGWRRRPRARSLSWPAIAGMRLTSHSCSSGWLLLSCFSSARCCMSS